MCKCLKSRKFGRFLAFFFIVRSRGSAREKVIQLNNWMGELGFGGGAFNEVFRGFWCCGGNRPSAFFFKKKFQGLDGNFERGGGVVSDGGLFLFFFCFFEVWAQGVQNWGRVMGSSWTSRCSNEINSAGHRMTRFKAPSTVPFESKAESSPWEIRVLFLCDLYRGGGDGGGEGEGGEIDLIWDLGVLIC